MSTTPAASAVNEPTNGRPDFVTDRRVCFKRLWARLRKTGRELFDNCTDNDLFLRFAHHASVTRSRTFFDGRPVASAEGLRPPDILWLNAEGTPRTGKQWDQSWGKSQACYLSGKGVRTRRN